MDIYTAFLAGVLVGHWVLLFAIWRAVTRLIRLINALEAEREGTPSGSDLRAIELLEDGRRHERYRNEW